MHQKSPPAGGGALGEAHSRQEASRRGQGGAPLGRLGDLGTPSVSHLACIYPPMQNSEISKYFFQKRSRSSPPSKPSFGGHQDPAPAPCQRGPWPPGSSSSTLLHPMMILK